MENTKIFFQAGNLGLVRQNSKSKWPPFLTDNLITSKIMFPFYQLLVLDISVNNFPNLSGLCWIKK